MNISNELISEVEKNKNLLLVGDVLYYVDGSNCEKWKVTKVFNSGFFATDDEGSEDTFEFKSLQRGWCFSEKTKEKNTLNLRYNYIS